MKILTTLTTVVILQSFLLFAQQTGMDHPESPTIVALRGKLAAIAAKYAHDPMSPKPEDYATIQNLNENPQTAFFLVDSLIELTKVRELP